MNRNELKKITDAVAEDIESIADVKVKSIISTLLNLIEILATENEELKSTVQKQKNEINKLKGEQGKPNIRKQKNDDDNNSKGGDHSSEVDRKPSKKSKKKKRQKKDYIEIDRKINCILNKDALPNDIVFKGYETKIIQDIIITTDNIEFVREVYYSPSLNITFIAELPGGYYGDFGPGVRALILSLYNDSKMTQPNIVKFFKTFDITISAATISRILTHKLDKFHQEKEDIIKAGLKSTSYQHFDDTGARVNGKNYYTHVLCNPFYTAFFKVPKKDRLAVLDILCCEELKFTFNSESFQLMLELGLTNNNLSALKNIIEKEVMSKSEVEQILEQ